MSQHSDHEELAKQYLLGTLSDEERVRLEEQYFSDDAEFEEVEIAEEELIDRYVRGELSETDRDRFETALASSPRLTERVQFARVWKEKLAASSTLPITSSAIENREAGKGQASRWSKLLGFSTESHTPRLAVAFSVLLILVGGIALLTGWLRLREQTRQLAAQQAALEQRQRELDKQAADLKSQADQLANRSPQPSPTENATPPKQVEEQSPTVGMSFVALALSPGGTRSSGPGHDLRIPPGKKDVRLTLNLRDPDYAAYQATIRTVDRKPVFTSDYLKPVRSRSGAALIFRAPANLLPPGDYSISVEGRTSTGTTEPVDDYSFRIHN